MFRATKRHEVKRVKAEVTICRAVLEAVYDECDVHDTDETGGRVVGFYEKQGGRLRINVCGMIGPGTNAQRTPTSFFQDGEYQERIFRELESRHRAVEHLGNWHTHHVNGLATLSAGDVGTYTRIVNHNGHNTDFFYALLVVARNAVGSEHRYAVKHFIVYRGDPQLYEILPSQVQISDEASIYVPERQEPADKRRGTVPKGNEDRPDLNQTRIRDKEALSEMHPEMKPFASKSTGSLYWRGPVRLIDDSTVEALVLEALEEGQASYSSTLAKSDAKRFQCLASHSEQAFDSARRALRILEQELNRELFKKAKG